MNTNIIRVGSAVIYRPVWGSAPATTARVVAIEVTEYPNQKYGVDVDAVHLDSHYVLSLDNNHWCYSTAVDGVISTHSEPVG
jgi:hypothetical protein